MLPAFSSPSTLRTIHLGSVGRPAGYSAPSLAPSYDLASSAEQAVRISSASLTHYPASEKKPEY